MNRSSDNFLRFIAYLQVIGIILVVLGHSFHEYPGIGRGEGMLLYKMLYSFRMPLFTFVSGFLMVYTTRIRPGASHTPPGRFAVSKVKRLMVPFAVLTLVTFIPRAILSGIADDPIELTAVSFVRAFIDNHALVIPYFWFLQASFLLLVFNYTLICFGEKARIADRYIYPVLVLLPVALLFSPLELPSWFSVDYTVRLGMYFALGAAYCRWAPAVDRIVRWDSPIVAVCLAGLWAVLYFVTEGTAWGVMCSLTGIAMCISVAKILEAHRIGVLDHLVGANYLIFLLSWYCNVGAQQVLHHYTDLPWWCYTVLSLTAGIYIPWILYRLMRRHSHRRGVRAAAFLLGQRL